MNYRKLSILFAAITAGACLLSSCAEDLPLNIDPNIDVSASDGTEEGDEEYIDSFIFFGESTTYHMKSRGVLSGKQNTTQVWGTKSGTFNLDTAVTSATIIYPETGEEMSISQAVKRKKPRRIMLSFGLNGAVHKIKKGKDYFKSCYRSLLDIIREASPSTEIFIQSAFPVAQSMDMSNYSVDSSTLNKYIRTINTWSEELAAEYGAVYLDTASVLKDESGALLPQYHVGDGHHLTAEAYINILEYIKSHKKQEE